MIQVTSENNQLKVVTNGSVEYYSYEDIKSISPFHEKKFIAGKTPTISYVVVVNFINENKNSPLRLRLSQIDNQATWTNTQAGLEQAVADISSWISAIALGLATEATLLNVDSNIADILGNTDAALRFPNIIRTTSSGNVNTVVPTFYSVSVANVGSADGTVLGGTIKPGEVLNFDASSLNHYFNSFVYNATGTEFVIIFVY